MTGGGVEGVWKVELAVRCLFESPIFVLWGGVHKSANPRKSFVWHWIAGIANSVRLSMYSNHNLDLGLTVDIRVYRCCF